MVTLRLFQDIEDLFTALQRIGSLESENMHSFRIDAKPFRGRYLFSDREKTFEYRFFDILLSENIEVVRAKSDRNLWYLSVMYGTIGLQGQNINRQPSEVIATAEMHNLKRDEVVVFQSPGHLRGCTIRMEHEFLASLTPVIAETFPYIDDTNHVALFESLDHEMIDLLTKTFRIGIDSPVFSKRIENQATEIACHFLEQISRRNSNTVAGYVGDDVLHRMLHASSLFADYHDPPSLKQISRFVGLGPSRTNALFKQVYGKTPLQFFNEKRMQEAYDLLHAKKYNVSQIGTMLGFANMSHFSKAFKKRYGTLPKKMQLQIQRTSG